jgi:hypothetical protein
LFKNPAELREGRICACTWPPADGSGRSQK